jgi:hypothetical protein
MPRRVQPTAQQVQIPAPVGGLNTAAAGLALPPGDCPYVRNLSAAENGLRSRFGSREWTLSMDGAGDEEVRTVVPVLGSGSPKLYAATSLGLYDATVATDTPDRPVDWPSPGNLAGWGSWTNMVSAAGVHTTFYADEENGLYRYSEAGGTWEQVAFGSAPGEIDGVDPGDIVFVRVFAGSLWLVPHDSASAWYLPAGQITGTAVEFPMGVKMPHGGTLVGLWDWTYDGGSGMDDALVAIGSGGDVLVYQGTDPNDASTFGLKGVWYMGPPPAGRRIASSYGGDLLLITRQGVVPMSRLVVGIPDARAESLTFKVSNLINTLMQERGNYRGWQIVQHPEDNALILLVPKQPGGSFLQLVQSPASKGWFIWNGLSMVCAEAFDKQLYFGDDAGRVLINTAYIDEVSLNDPNAFQPVEWSLVTAASEYGAPRQKQVGLIRPVVLTDGATPAVAVTALYGYRTTPPDFPALVNGGAGTWNNATWDVDVWQENAQPAQPVSGAAGMGTAVSIAVSGRAINRTVLVAIDVSYTMGGML